MSFSSKYDAIIHHPSASTAASPPLLIVYIPGNPGLAPYYTEYLSYLHKLCADIPYATHIYAFSLPGFLEPAPLRNLDEMIDFVDEALETAWMEVGRDAKVVLAAHSMGAYMMLEILRRRKGGPMRILAGIGLTPTVTDIQGSSNGLRVRWIGAKEWFAPAVGGLAKALCWIFPNSAVTKIVQMVTGMPHDAAQTTARFIRCSTGVEQALYLMRHELRQMTVDKWDDELWGAVKNQDTSHSTKLFFLFAERDHWVADHARDKLIATRAYSGKVGEEGKPHMEIDRTGLPHAFCLRHSEAVAQKTFGYISEVL